MPFGRSKDEDLFLLSNPVPDRVKVAAKTWCGHVPMSTCPQVRLSIKQTSLLNYFCIFEDHFFIFKELFRKNSVLMYVVVS